MERMATARLGYNDPSGSHELRTALAAHLGRSRGTAAVADQLIIAAGFTGAFGIVCRVLHAKGARRIAVEEPGWPTHHLIAAHFGLEPIPVLVDDNGMQTDLLEGLGVDAVVLTPAHQFPTGAVLSSGRRTRLVELARKTGMTIIEDDYDAEYRYDRAPIGALQGLCPDVVVYIGSASKILAPGLRLGWIVAPPRLQAEFNAEKKLTDPGSPMLDQLTLGEFITTGELGRHLRRMRTHYRQRRDTLVAALGEAMPHCTVTGISAGLHLMVTLPAYIDEARLLAQAQAAGLRLAALSSYQSEPTTPEALILGYSRLHKAAIKEGISLLGDLANQGRPPT